MGHEPATAQRPVSESAAPGGSRAARVAVAARLVLLLAWAAIAGNAVTEARDASLGELERARAADVPVQVVSVSEYPASGEVTRDGWLAATYGPWFGIVGLLAIGGSLAVLISGRQPWFATRWAWFWLVWAVPVLWVAFLALEPRPLRLSLRWAAAGRPTPLLGDGSHRLTGGWAFVIAWAASSLLAAAGLPMLSAWG